MFIFLSARSKKPCKMSSPIVIGCSVLYNHLSGPGAGVWSGQVTKIFRQDDMDCASVTLDGIVVPPMNRCGMQPPWNWTNSVDLYMKTLTLRTPAEDDAEKRLSWQKKVRQYTDCQNAVADMKHVAEVQRFSHVTPGMPVTWIMNAGDFCPVGDEQLKCHFKGVISSIRKNGVEAHVTGIAAEEADKERTFCLHMGRLIFV